LRLRLRQFFVLSSLCIAGASFAFADISVVENFPTAGDAYTSFTNGNGTIPPGGQTAYQWTTGDSVTSALFTDVPAPSINGLTENWTYKNVLGPIPETWAVLVNGTQVGSESLVGCAFCGSNFTLTDSLSFAPVAAVGGGYQVELLLENTIPPGDGSVAWLDGGTTTLNSSSATPEPSEFLPVVIGAVFISGLAWRRRRSMSPFFGRRG
jgi:hypothetical protein